MINYNNLQRSDLLKVLWNVQNTKRCIEHDDITKIALAFNISRMDVEGVATFYHFFHRKHAGKYTIYLNNAIVGIQAGMENIKAAFEKELGIFTGNTTSDKMFGLFETACIGLSDQEPACLINFMPFTDLTPKKVSWIISELKSGTKISEIYDAPQSNIRYTPENNKAIFFSEYQRYSALQKLKKYSPVEIIELIKSSKLGGRGGAFFPTGRKWEICRSFDSDIKYIVCNADEGEPGTFKDRVLIQENPAMLIEGMIIAAYAVGATQGAIYLRGEYAYLQELLEDMLRLYRKAGLLGKSIGAKEPFDFDIYVELGAGAYVCGEETALLHSMEGFRGEPGNKQFFPVEKGFKGKPTIVNNVETLCAVPLILNIGVDHWLSLGTALTPGTKVLSISGDCARPGIYEIEWGMTIRELLVLAGARDTNMVQFSGPSGSCLSRADFNKRICGEDIICGGSVMIFNAQRNILEIMKNFTEFFIAESCGLCVPCRNGNFLLEKKIDKLISGLAEEKDFEDIKEWSHIIATTSRCGLGQMSSCALNDAIKKFPEVFRQSIAETSDYNRAFSLKKAVVEYDEYIKKINVGYEK